MLNRSICLAVILLSVLFVTEIQPAKASMDLLNVGICCEGKRFLSITNDTDREGYYFGAINGVAEGVTQIGPGKTHTYYIGDDPNGYISTDYPIEKNAHMVVQCTVMAPRQKEEKRKAGRHGKTGHGATMWE